MGLSESQINTILQGIRPTSRGNFTIRAAAELVNWGYNVFICHPNHRVDGNYTHAHYEYVHTSGWSTIGFEVYVMEKGNTVYATNFGDGTYENWAFGGNFNRNDKTITFY